MHVPHPKALNPSFPLGLSQAPSPGKAQSQHGKYLEEEAEYEIASECHQRLQHYLN